MEIQWLLYKEAKGIWYFRGSHQKKQKAYGISGALMAKAGKKVLILEQHDQAGGCCHTFIDKGYE